MIVVLKQISIFALIIGNVLSIGNEDVRCLESSCKTATCATLPIKCNSSEANSGLYMLSPDICNCCEYCLAYIDEGEECSVGDPSNAKHTSMCGPGLTCVTKQGHTDGTCQKMSTSCALDQQSFDERRKNGTLGTMETKITCDDDGLYGSYKCIPGQYCYCLHSNGTRIFGSANWKSIPDLDCACSRAYYDASDIVGRTLAPHEHFRCTAEGSFDRIQCINDGCLCVDQADGAPTYPNDVLVDIRNVSTETLKCYEEDNIYRKCEEEYMKVRKEMEQMKKDYGYSLIMGYTYPKCDLDGTYVPIQENKTHKYCVDKQGIPITTGLVKADATVATLIATMDCNCARATELMTTQEKPQCKANGNFEEKQCRRGVCRCVDANGNQICSTTPCEVDEIDKDTLTC